MDLRTSRVFFTIFGQCINVLNYKYIYIYICRPVCKKLIFFFKKNNNICIAVVFANVMTGGRYLFRVNISK